MSAYLPSGPWAVGILAAVLLAVFLLGYALNRLRPSQALRAAGWVLLTLGTFGTERLAADEGPGFRMVALILFALLALKIIVTAESRRNGMPPLTFPEWAGFAAGWLGMQPRLFAGWRRRPRPEAGRLVRMGLVRAAAGAVVVLLAWAAFRHTGSYLLMSALLLAGISFLLHFGFCNVMAGAWRGLGVNAGPLFRAPLKSQNLKEFWGRRWNLAFSEMGAIAVYRPLAGPLGQGTALFAVFVLSGLLHEMAISLPVKAGYGQPTLYFLLHGLLVLLENALAARGRPIQGWFGRVWTIFWLAAPLPLLFHRHFLAGAIWPLIGV